MPAHLSRAQVTRMTLVKMQYKASNPIYISLLGANTVMLEANFSPHLI